MKTTIMLALALLFLGAQGLGAATRSSARKAKTQVKKQVERAEKKVDRAMGWAPKNLIIVSPGVYSTNGYSSYGALIGYERDCGGENSIIAQLAVDSSGPGAYNTTVVGLGGGYRWYLLGGGNLKGLYAGPKAMFSTSTFSYRVGNTTYTSAATLIKVAGEAGYQTSVWKDLFVGGTLELSYTSGTYATVAGVAAPYNDGIRLGSYAHVGWAF
jgi:hypothetical protein